ncbi:MAG: phosphoribosylglycinamide formyltransferase [Caldisericia bacterium]|nr:phosphoribosylglycinamide formyltransferase [Caldisericia bacterium]
MSLKKVAIFISGRGSNLESLLKKRDMGRIKCEIPFVLSNREDARGLQIAEEKGIKTYLINHRDYPVRKDFESAVLQLTEKHEVDIIVLAGFMKVLSAYFVRTFNKPIINIHPSLLPSFPGLNSQNRALEYGVKFAGCTVHFVTEDVDAGPIIGQEIIPVFNDDSEESIALRILEREHILLSEALSIVINGNYEIIGRRVFVNHDKD